jgi:2-oxoacid:acceptor oxidoreductase delta subunit (pyruvate/2-ketoisovalerate family)
MKRNPPAPKTCSVPGTHRVEPDLHSVVAETIHENWQEIEQTYDSKSARAEATRCLATLTCTYCEVCQLMCPDMCITRDSDTGNIHIDLTYCKACGLCAHFCPKGAIEMVPE